MNIQVVCIGCIPLDDALMVCPGRMPGATVQLAKAQRTTRHNASCEYRNSTWSASISAQRVFWMLQVHPTYLARSAKVP